MSKLGDDLVVATSLLREAPALTQFTRQRRVQRPQTAYIEPAFNLESMSELCSLNLHNGTAARGRVRKCAGWPQPMKSESRNSAEEMEVDGTNKE